LWRLAPSQIRLLSRACAFRARRLGTLADAFGSPMLGECWVGSNGRGLVEACQTRAL
jgi:hypothetical protein